MRIRGLITFISYFFIQIILAIIINFLAILFESNFTNSLLLILLFSNLIVLVIGLLVNKKYLFDNIRSNIFEKSTYTIYALGVGLYIVLSMLIATISINIVGDTDIENQASLEEAMKNSNIIISFIAIVIITPITEELVFRYSLINFVDTSRKYLKWIPYVLSAVIFAIIHEYKIIGELSVENLMNFLKYFIPSLSIVGIYAVSRRNFITISLLHITINALAFTAMIV